MNLERKIRRCNRILSENASAMGGLFAWKWSNEIEFVFQKANDEGEPTYDYKADPDSGLIRAVRAYERSRIVDIEPSLKNLWVLCAYQNPDMSPEAWERIYGGLVPRQSGWVPCDPVWLPAGVEPNEDMTWDVVTAYKRQSEVTTKEFEQSIRDAMEKKEQSHRKMMRDMIRNDFPAFNGIPGKKGLQHYSIGGVKDVPLAN